MRDTLRDALAALPRPLSPSARLPRTRPQGDLTRAFGQLVTDLEFPNLGFHDLRHHTGRRLTMAGVPQRNSMEILGHHDPRMRMRYRHLSPGLLREAMTVLASPTPSAQPATDDSDRHHLRTEWKKSARGVRPAPKMVDDTGLEPVTPGM